MSTIFDELDFERFEHPLSDHPAYRMQFGPHEIEATVLVNRCLQPIFMLHGVVNTGRTIGMVEAQLPLHVVSEEEGVALISHFLADQIPEGLKPPWLLIGERMSFDLPWVKKPSDGPVGATRQERL